MTIYLKPNLSILKKFYSRKEIELKFNLYFKIQKYEVVLRIPVVSLFICVFLQVLSWFKIIFLQFHCYLEVLL